MKFTATVIAIILNPLLVLGGRTNAVHGEESSTSAMNLRRSLKSKKSDILKSPKAAKSSKAPKAAKSSKAPKAQKTAKASKSHFMKAPALLEIDLDVFGEVHPAKMDIGPDGKLYFTGGTDSKAYRGDIEGNFENFAEITTGAGFTLGCQFDKDGNYYMVNGAGVYMVSSASIMDATATLPIEPEMFYAWTTGLAIPMSIDIDNNTGMAYVTDMGLGEIWRIDTATREGSVWASSNQPGYELLYGDPNSTNFLGVPFGAVEVMVDGDSNWLYFSAHERNYFGRIKIMENGDAGVLQVLAIVKDRAALNGAFLDVRNNKFYGATPFLNFHNGVEREPKATRGGEIWMLDLDDVDENGNGGEAVRVWKDLDYGTLTDVITGYGFGDEEDLYLLDGSFDTLTWPTGVVPDPDAPYHGAVRKLKGKSH